MEVDTKIPNAATFAIEREDHTLGNILRGYIKQKLPLFFRDNHGNLLSIL